MAEEKSPKLKTPVTEQDHVLGSIDAPVVLLEYGDYQCPYCSQVLPIIKALRQRFDDRLCFVFRHFPISTAHPQAQLAAEVAEAAAAQGKFWEMHELLYENQGNISRNRLNHFAEMLELDTERFEQDLDEHVYSEHVRRDFLDGVKSGANGTPTFFLNGARYDGPWDIDSLVAEIEKPLGVQVRFLFQQFTRLQASGGILLLIATVVALIWANSAWGQSYFSLWKTYLKIVLGESELKLSLLHWVNDGLMVIFFFLVGLEIKREILVGELASLRKATLPLAAAIGGIFFPALLYFLFNIGGEGSSGWGIPMATDIAFLLGILTVLRDRIPVSLKVFFTALAIADDLGAVLVIALFYSGEISWFALGVGAVILAILIVLNRGQVRRPLPYVLLGVGLWLAFLQSGIHPTIAGVLLALTIPAQIPIRASAFLAQCNAALGGVGPGMYEGADHQRQAAAQTLEVIAERIQTPLQRLERTLNPWVAYLIVPIFALSNAGVNLRINFAEALATPIALGIIVGLVIGKPLGITFFSWIAVKVGISDLPHDVNWKQLISASCLAGIGFTMSLFIADSAFSGTMLGIAKTSILIASLLAAIFGYILLIMTTTTHQEVSNLDIETGNS